MAIKRVTYDTLKFLVAEIKERYAEKGDIGALGGLDKVAVENLTEDLKSLINGKADAATTLAGYGIKDGMTATEVAAAISTAIAGTDHLSRVMPEGVDFPFPSLLFHEGRTYGQPEVVRISLPQVATGLRLRLPGSFRRRAFHADLLMPQEALFARGAHSMQAVMHRALLRRGRSGRYHFLFGKTLPAGNQSRIRQKGGNGSWRFFIIQ